jgi:signal transduction histidine kinase
MLAIYRWFTRVDFGGGTAQLSPEAIALRTIGLIYLIVFSVASTRSKPHPGLSGSGLAVLIALIVFVVGAIATQPRRTDVPEWRRVAALSIVTAAAAVLGAEQPKGIWTAGGVFVAIMAAVRLGRRNGLLMLVGSLTALVIVCLSTHRHNAGAAEGLVASAVPWFLVIRMISQIRGQRDALKESQEAEARAAAAAERGRLAREMHDVLAHSLSALALQLESTRLLARAHGVDEDVARAIDQAHHLAASGLQDARRAIAAARGDELPGPERIEVLADAFQEQSGLAVAVQVSGEPRELAPDARLALYRTAQEALTNVRRHAAAERVELKLSYLDASTVLVVEDHAPLGTPPPATLGLAGNGYGLTGMRERAKLLGGELLAEPTSEGFRVELRLPA